MDTIVGEEQYDCINLNPGHPPTTWRRRRRILHTVGIKIYLLRGRYFTDALFCGILRLPQRADELPDAYFLRRARFSKELAVRRGLWSTRVSERILSWEAHLRRPKN